jgi:predicted outer membrane repeat protein
LILDLGGGMGVTGYFFFEDIKNFTFKENIALNKGGGIYFDNFPFY